MKKSFLYAAMPLLNWRLSAAVQLSDPEGGGGGGREGERGRDMKHVFMFEASTQQKILSEG